MPARFPISCFLVALATGGCAPRSKAPGPVEKEATPLVRSESDGVVNHSEAGGVYQDATVGFDAAVPTGWTARSRFLADASGPPPKGNLRARFSDPASGCVIDLALETLPEAGEAGLKRALIRGRELFFYSRIEEPRPNLDAGDVWTATLVPADPSRVDVGYWISVPQAGASHYLRVEGRFPLPSFALCKDRLDDVVRSIRTRGATGARGGAPSSPKGATGTRAIAPNP